MTVEAYPLAWPVGWKRTEPHRRTAANFGTVTGRQVGENIWKSKTPLTIAQATDRVLAELRRMAVESRTIIVSTNLRLRNDGLPLSKQRQPDDPGAAVYWTDPFVSSRKLVLAVDRYYKIEENLAAIAATIEAMRQIERHGGAVILERAFTGFAALPAPMAAGRPWRDVLKTGALDATVEAVQDAYRRRRSETHPDKGGTPEAFQAVQAAYEEASRELGFVP